MVRAEDLVEHERDRIKTLEQTLKILQSATLPPTTNTSSASTGGDEEDEMGLEDGMGGSKIEGLEMKGLSVMQRRKIMMLRNKREKLDKERIKLGLVEA